MTATRQPALQSSNLLPCRHHYPDTVIVRGRRELTAGCAAGTHRCLQLTPAAMGLTACVLHQKAITARCTAGPMRWAASAV